MAFCMSRLHLAFPSGSRITVSGPRWRCDVTLQSSKLRHLYTSKIAAPNHRCFFHSVNAPTRSGCFYPNRQSSFNVVNLIQRRTEANVLYTTYLYQSNAAGIRQRIFPMLLARRNYSEGAPGSPKSTDAKPNATSSSTTAGEGSGNAASSSATVQSSSQRIKVFLKEYGTVGFVFHISMSLCVLSVCYLLVSNGLDVDKVFEYFNVESSATKKGASTFAISYLLYKMLMPVRVTITIACVPVIVRSLRARGLMKGVAKTPAK